MEAAPWTGKDIFRDGVWCIKDIGTPKYAKLGSISQSTVPYTYQASYGYKMLYLIAVIIALFIIKRVVYAYADRDSKTVKENSNCFKTWFYKISAFNRWVSYRRFPRIVCDIFQVPSSFGNFIIIIAGLLYMLCYTFIPKFWYRTCGGFGSPPLAIRAGLQATALFPIIIILSGKTNLVSDLTDISYEKLNVYHRWVSVMCCFLAWVHVIPFYIQAVREGGIERLSWFMSHDDNLYRNGIPPLVFLTVLTIFSHSYIRAAWYELWLQIHWICAIGMYVSLFIHVKGLMDGNNYMIATIVFWFTQLCWRALTKSSLKPNKGFLRSNKCQMRRLSSTEKDEFFEIVVENSFDFTWVPGQHLFVRIPGLRFLENHPFSIVSYCEPRHQNEIKLIVRAGGLGGLTKFIYNKLPETGCSESNIIIDGPYGGCMRQVDAFDSVFLVATGTGISAVLPFLKDACVKMSSAQGIIKSVRFDWIVKSIHNVDWIHTELQSMIASHKDLIASGKVIINIYVKEEFNSIDFDGFSTAASSSDSEAEDKEVKISNEQNINIVNSRPNVTELVKDSAQTLDQRNMYIICGSDSMKVEASNAIANLQTEVFAKNKVQEIYLHSESYGW